MERLKALLPPDAGEMLMAHGDEATQVRLRAKRPAQIVWGRGHEALAGPPLDGAALRHIMAALMEYSVYARQDELDRGFFTLNDGSRVGVCGRMVGEGERLRMAEIGSACVRIARAVPGCADQLLPHIAPAGGAPHSMLLISPPGMGKTTMLRDIARRLSDGGLCVSMADERHEMAACHMGVPTLDVGARTDVMDGCPRVQAIARMLRAMAPRVVVADEIGGAGDAVALADAARCGAAVVTSAHAGSLEEALARPCLRSVLETGVVSRVALLGPHPGMVAAVWRREAGEGVAAWKRA